MLEKRRPPIGWSTAFAVALVSSAMASLVPAAAATTTATTILAFPANPQGGHLAVVQIPIFAGPADGIFGIDMTVQYDSAVLQAQSVAVSGIASTAGFAMASNLATPGSIIMSEYANTNPLSGSGEIARIQFRVVGSPGNTSYLRFLSQSINEGAIPSDTSSGTFTVTCTGAASGTPCGNACFVGATCQLGACSGGTTIVVPSEIAGVTAGSLDSDITWTASSAGPGTVYDVARGVTRQLPVGGGIESCFASGVGTATVSDGSAPLSGDSYWYLVRGRNTCGTGTYGYAAVNGAPTVERVTSACP